MLIEALESELQRVTTRWRGPDDGRATTSAVDPLIQARTLLRRALSLRLESDDARQTETLMDLRMAEAAFSFLLRLRVVRRAAAGL